MSFLCPHCVAPIDLSGTVSGEKTTCHVCGGKVLTPFSSPTYPTRIKDTPIFEASRVFVSDYLVSVNSTTIRLKDIAGVQLTSKEVPASYSNAGFIVAWVSLVWLFSGVVISLVSTKSQSKFPLIEFVLAVLLPLVLTMFGFWDWHQKKMQAERNLEVSYQLHFRLQNTQEVICQLPDDMPISPGNLLNIINSLTEDHEEVAQFAFTEPEVK